VSEWAPLNYTSNGRHLLSKLLRIFSSITCLKKPVFSKRDLLQWKVPTRLN
jgi:hypothetical protein